MGSTLIYFDALWEVVVPEYNRALLAALERAGFDVDPIRFPDQFHERMDAYFDERDTEFVEYTTGTILRNLLADIGYAKPSDETLRRILRELYASTQAHWHAEPDAAPTLARLHAQGYRLAVVSNASDDEDVQTLVDSAGFRPYLDAVITSAAAGIRKPNPHIFELALGQIGVPPSQAVMVGDLLGADIVGAQKLSMPAIWIERRVDKSAIPAQEQSIHPDATISELSVIPDLLERWNRERQDDRLK
jgi:putative hydrolase of the HAD superfamily